MVYIDAITVGPDTMHFDTMNNHIPDRRNMVNNGTPTNWCKSTANSKVDLTITTLQGQRRILPTNSKRSIMANTSMFHTAFRLGAFVLMFDSVLGRLQGFTPREDFNDRELLFLHQHIPMESRIVGGNRADPGEYPYL